MTVNDYRIVPCRACHADPVVRGLEIILTRSGGADPPPPGRRAFSRVTLEPPVWSLKIVLVPTEAAFLCSLLPQASPRNGSRPIERGGKALKSLEHFVVSGLLLR